MNRQLATRWEWQPAEDKEFRRDAVANRCARVLCWGVLAAIAALLSSVAVLGDLPQASPEASIVIVEPDGVGDVVAEGHDFATHVLRAPWDMESPPYPDFQTVLGNISRSTFAVSGGRWDMRTTNGDPRVSIHPTGLAEAALNVGRRFPIDADRYVLLSFRMCSDDAGQAQVFWFYDQTFTQFAGSKFIPVRAGCHIYVVDLRRIGTNTLRGGASGWDGSPIGLSIDPIAAGSDVHLGLDWARLTTADTSHTLPIAWERLGAVKALIEFFVDTDTTGCDGKKIGEVRDAKASGIFEWGSALLPSASARPYPLPESLEPGQYYICVKVNGSQAMYSPGPLTIDSVPIVAFSRPSVIGGQDYATAVVGDSWDMSNPYDVAATEAMVSSTFTDGAYHGLTDQSGDSQVLLRVGAPIDTHSYRHLTYRMYVEGTQSIGTGWVSRVHWWNAGPTVDAVTTNDIVVYEGWQTYSVDLSKIGLERSRGSGWDGEQRTLRLDPVEAAAPMRLHLDYVMLTDDERVRRGAPFPVVYRLNEPAGTTVTLCVDSNQNPDDGRAPLRGYQPWPSPGSHRVFFPLTFRRHGSVNDLPRPEGTRVLWDTGSVEPGTYYICADVDDGVNIATWYSEMPVIVAAE